MLSINSLLKTPRLYGVKVSPDRKWVVWTWANIGPNAEVYIAPLDKSGNPRKMTDFKQDTSVSSWSEDSQSIVVKHDYDGDERYRLYKLDIKDGTISPLTEANPTYFIRGGKLHPTNKYLIYAANYDFNKNEEIEPTIVYRHNLETGERLKLTDNKKPGFVVPQLNSKGTQIIYQRNDRDPSGRQIWMVDIEGKKDKEILNFGDKIKVSASWHPNGENIIFIAEEKSYRKVGIYNLENGNIRWVLDDPLRNIEDAYVPHGSDFIVIDEIKGAQNKISLINYSSLKEASFSDLQTVIPLAQISDKLWLSKYYNSSRPGDLIIYKYGGIKVERKITDVFKYVDYSSSDLARAENYTWRSVDGLAIQGWLYKPKVSAIGTIVPVHGGPTGHSEDAFDIDIQFFVSQGFNVFDPNYRGSTGFGLDFQEAIKKDGWGGKEQEDILEGIKALIRDKVAEPYKIGITGTSYGGYSSWHAITHFPIKYIAASAPICGMTDLVVDYNTTRPDLRGYSEEMMGGSPSQVPERYRQGSPIYFVKNIKGKLLIVQGARDPNVTPENVKVVEEELQKNNIKYEKLVFEDEGHGISKPQNQKILLTKLGDFFKESFQ